MKVYYERPGFQRNFITQVFAIKIRKRLTNTNITAHTGNAKAKTYSQKV